METEVVGVMLILSLRVCDEEFTYATSSSDLIGALEKSTKREKTAKARQSTSARTGTAWDVASPSDDGVFSFQWMSWWLINGSTSWRGSVRDGGGGGGGVMFRGQLGTLFGLLNSSAVMMMTRRSDSIISTSSFGLDGACGRYAGL